MLGGRHRLRVLLFAVVAVLGAGLGVLGYATNALRSLELNTVDTRFSIRGTEKPRDDLVVVGVDEKTFGNLPGRPRWPFTHDFQARMVDRLRREGANVIALDIQFSELSNTNAQSIALLDAIDRAGNVVASTTAVDPLGNGNAFTYIGVPRRIVKSRERRALTDYIEKDLDVVVAYGNFPTDPGGVLRRVTYDSEGLKTFSLAVAEKVKGRRIDPAELGGDSAWIDYYGPPRTIRHVSYSDVLQGKTKPGEFRDKIVVVGATAPSLQDLHATSTSGDGEMAGPEIQANAVATALAGFPLKDSPTPLDVGLVVLLGLVAPVASLRLSGVRALVVALVAGAIYAVVTQLAFNGGMVLSLVYPLAALALSAVGALAVHYVTEAFERERTRDLFARFVPESVVGEALDQAEGLRLGGVAREATVMFSDLRGFTSFAESLEPDQVITILNHYLTAMVDDAILPHGGTLVDYMGDGIMAVFGAPVEMDDHADRALAAARDKLAELERFNDWLREEYGFEKSFRMGIGLNSGRVMSGNVGSERRLAYTAIGDTTNTAARLEAMTKGTPHMLFLSDSTRAALTEEPDDLVYVDEFEVRGRQQKVKLWSVGQATDEGQAGQTFESVSKG
jgi:adenylate cyclase